MTFLMGRKTGSIGNDHTKGNNGKYSGKVRLLRTTGNTCLVFYNCCRASNRKAMKNCFAAGTFEENLCET